VASPSDPAADPWPEPDAFEANAAGHVTPGQHRMLLGGPTPPPYAALAVLAVTAVSGAVLWWRSGFGPGITVILIGANIGLAVLSMNLDRRRRRRRLRSDLGRPAIGGGIGEVAVAAGRVDIRSGTGPIELGLAAPAAPVPGWYRMHWLEHPGAPRWSAGRVLLSAHPIAAPDGARTGPDTGPDAGPDPLVLAEIAARLRDVLRRAEWELGFNRTGELSPPQRDELRRAARARLLARSAGAGAGTLVAALLLVTAVLAWRRGPSDDRSALVGGLISAGLGLVVGWFTVRAAVRLPEAAAAVGGPPPLARASGPVTATVADAENDTWTLTLDGGITFHVTADVARAFGTPLRYTVYYVSRGRERVLLAAEPDRR
jgi:hypothetical protein